ncbi:MAG TPA: IS21 family transposase [Verrucomicrobiae bacterium]|nr:IS21 family transposase [Verrucomicrobiae bacterium]
MNQLNVSLQHSIATLAAKGWSSRKIARELSVDRETVRRYRGAPDSKPAIPPTGSTDPSEPKPAIAPAGSEGSSSPKPAIVPTGSKAGRASQCAPWSALIEQGLLAGLQAQRIYQDLVADHGFTGGYDSVKRFVRSLRTATDAPFRRMECAPGEELQVDFGLGGWVIEDGKRRRPHLFRAVLSHSRKAYSEVVWRQSSESFIRCLENAFRYFGGVPATVVIDNLKAGVIQADWFDPELNPKLEEFARYYGTVILPTKPAMPRHKGKIESGVKYAQNNAVKGRTFTSLTEQNSFLSDWEKNVADTRIHGTTRRQVGKLFEEVEGRALHPLPVGLFPVFEEARRTVHRDGYVEFKRAYYSAPPEYVGRQVWVRQETRLLRLYNTRREQIALHALAEPGKFTTDSAHLHSRKRHIIERGADYLLDRCRMIGPLTGTWAEVMHQTRGPQSLRVMQGLLQLAEKHPAAELEKAARVATHHGTWRLQDLKRLLDLPGNVVQMDFLESHPLIRSLEAYRIELNTDQNTTPST